MKWMTIVALAGLLAGCSHQGKGGPGLGPEDLKTREFIEQRLREDGILEGSDTVLYRKVQDRVQAMPYLAIYNAEHRLVFEQLGYREDLPQILDSVFSGSAPPPEKGRKMLPLRTLDGGWFDFNKLPHARFTVFEFWASWCGPCRWQMKVLHNYLATSPLKNEIQVVRVLCERFAFPPRKDRHSNDLHPQ